MIESNLDSRQIFMKWIRATWLGWLLGVPLIVALALLGEAVGIGGSQTIVGIGMGAGIGLMQGRALRHVVHQSAHWFWACVIGLATPFLVADVAKVAGWNFPYSLYLSVALGGLIVGIWQAFILRSRNTAWWIVASVAGWTLAAGTAALADALPRAQSIRGLAGALVYLGFVAMGGLVLGVVTGSALVGVLREKSAI